MSAGNRKDLITFQRAGLIDDGYTEREDWGSPTDIGQEWARLVYGSGTEQRRAASEGGDLPATFLVLDNPLTRSVTLADRIFFDEGAWDITSNKPANTPGERAITATRAA